MEAVMIDAAIVRAHACMGKKVNLNKLSGGVEEDFLQKSHALVDALGNPLKFILSAGQRHEISQADSLIEGISGSIVIGDKGYDSNAFVKTLTTKACLCVILPKRNRSYPRNYDEYLYKERHLIECLFGKIKHFRRIFSRFDKIAPSFLSFLHFVSTFIWLR
jgi:transposase